MEQGFFMTMEKTIDMIPVTVQAEMNEEPVGIFDDLDETLGIDE